MTTADHTPTSKIKIHPGFVRIFHWLNVLGMFLMITSGWRIYNASPVFEGISFPAMLTIGGWLGGAIKWHLAAMWLLAGNFLVYLVLGFATGHFRRSLTPISPKAVITDLGKALHYKLPHETGRYNAVQKASYIGVMAIIILTIASGLVVWKSVQFQTLGLLFGGYEGARIVHFFGMTGICLFIVMHLVLVLIVPATFIPMITGWAKPDHNEVKSNG